MPSNFFFYIALSFIILHEMDAIRCREWRIFPLLSRLSDKMGFTIFMLAHIPLFTLLFYGLGRVDNQVFIKGLNYFFIIHLLLHLLLLKHPKNEFKDWMSWLCIIGAAIFGGVSLLVN